MQRTHLEELRQSRVVVVVVVVVVGAYSPVTGNCADRLHGSTTFDDVGSRNYVVAHSLPLLVELVRGSVKVHLFRPTLPLHSVLMLPLKKVPLLLRAKVPLLIRVKVKVQRA